MNPRNKCIILGALCTQSGRYTLPTEATKGNPYTCIGCSDNVFVKQGERNIHHFCHYPNSECKYYEHASESEIHKNAKLRLKSLLEQKCEVSFIRKCKLKSIPFGYGRCERNPDIYSIPVVTKTSKIVLEYPFKIGYSGVTYFADVAYIDGDEPLCMIEVCHTHTTSKERRVDPWFEVSAKNVLEAEIKDNAIQFTCIRQEVCDECVTEGYERRYKSFLSSYSILSMKDEELEFFVRYHLGQRDFKGEYEYHAEGDHKWYAKCRSDHRRIHFDEGDKNNNEIIALFHLHLNNKQVMIQTRKGSCDVLIVSDKDKTDYTKTSISCNPLSKNYNGWGTVDIIKDILKCAHKLRERMNNQMTMSSFLSDYIMMDRVRAKRIKELQTKK